MKENTGQLVGDGPNRSKKHNPISYEKDILMMHLSPVWPGSKPPYQHTFEQYILAPKANVFAIGMVRKVDPLDPFLAASILCQKESSIL